MEKCFEMEPLLIGHLLYKMKLYLSIISYKAGAGIRKLCSSMPYYLKN
jgi:hypothetical protein